jgi:PAS domain S-box-containing protein
MDEAQGSSGDQIHRGCAQIHAGLLVRCRPVHEASEPGDDDDLRRVAEAAEAVLVIENTPLPIMVLLLDGEIALANRAFGAFLGYGPGALLGANVRQIMADVTDFERRWSRVVNAEGVTTDRVVNLRRQDGAPVTARVAHVVVTDDAGAPRFVVARALSTRQEMAG